MEKELGTTYNIIGGNNPTRIGASCSIIEHKFKKGVPLTRIMLDAGALITHKDAEVDVIIPDIREYLGTKNSHPAIKLDAIFLTHGHEDHFGGYIHLARAGYTFPPTYASKETLEMLKTFLTEAGINLNSSEWKDKFIPVKSGSIVNFKGVDVEAISMSHSTAGSLGFHFLTKIDETDEAGILHLGDYNLRNVIVSEGFNKKELEDLAERKLITHVFLDSTSTGSNSKNMISYDEGYKNYLKIFEQHSDKQIFVPVISGSVQNWANVLRAAKEKNRKVYIDGYRLGLVYQSMLNAGMQDFDVVEDNINKFLKLPLSKRLGLLSGAMGEEFSGLHKLVQQEKVRPVKEDKKTNTKKKKTKKTGHPLFTLDKSSLLVLSQRGIKDLSFNDLSKYANMAASLGATVIITEADDLLGNFQTERLQGSCHAYNIETFDVLSTIVNGQKKLNNTDVTCMPTHGNPSQLTNTAKIAEKAGLKFYIFMNANEVKLTKHGENKTSKVAENTQNQWIGVTQISDNTSDVKEYVYTLVDENFKSLGEVIDTITVKVNYKKKYKKIQNNNKNITNFKSKNSGR